MNRNETLLKLGIFFVLIVTSLLLTDTSRSVSLKPFGIHTWRQSDSAAQFRNYYQNNASFWKPQLMNLTGREGVAAAEFPVTYYVAAQLAKVFGYSEAWCRGLHLFLFILGVYCFYLISLRFIKNVWLAIIPPALLLNTPLCFYYANNFLPNMPAISMVLIGWYFYFRYVVDSKAYSLWFMLFFMTLGAMIKASEGIHIVAAFFSLLHARYWLKRPFPKYFLSKVLLGTLLGLACIGGWVYYAKWLNQGFGNHMSLLGILPIWEMSPEDMEYTWGVLKKNWMPVLGSPVSWWFFGVSLFYLLLPGIWKSPLFIPSLLIGAGSLAYGLLWYQAFMVHDYYLLTMTVFPAFIVLTAITSLSQLRLTVFWQWALNLVFIAFAGFNMYYNGQWQLKRTDPAASEINLEFYTLEPYLRRIGIDRKDKIISVPDPSPNISLYMSNNPGWSDALNGGINNPEPYIEMGAQYLVAGDSTVFSRPGMEPYLQDLIGRHGKFSVYRLSPLPDKE